MTYRVEVSYFGTWLLNSHVHSMHLARAAALALQKSGIKCRIVLCAVLEEYDE